MPITVEDPGGQQHTFADGTPDAVINAEMAKRWSARSAPPTPQPRPLTTPDKLPPGTTPGTMAAKSETLLQSDMVPLSADAQRGMRMIIGGGATNNKALEQAGRMLLEKDPTYQARTKQSAAMGEAAAKRSEMRLAGEQILRSYAKLKNAFDKTDDETLKGAIGPYATKPYASYLPLVGGMTAPEAGAAYGLPLRLLSGAADAEKSWNAQNLFSHDVHGLTNAFIANAPKGLNMSDERQKAFDSAMRDFMRSTSRDEANRILDHAKSIITNDFNLTATEADSIIGEQMKRLAGESAQKDLLRAAARVPPTAVEELLANAGNPAFVRSFNKHFNADKPGLAESLIEARRP